MKTLEEIKDEVAQKYEFADWQNIQNQDWEESEIFEWQASLINEVAERYAKAKLEEAAEKLQYRKVIPFHENGRVHDRTNIEYNSFIKEAKESITKTPLE